MSPSYQAIARSLLPVFQKSGTSDSVLREALADRQGAEFAHQSDFGPRGLAGHVIEAAVQESNDAARKALLSSYGNASLPHLALDQCTAQAVTRRALTHKLASLEPFISVWHEAIAIEILPANAPHAARLLAEFVDDVAYFRERATSIATLRALAQLMHTPSNLEALDYDTPNGAALFWGRGRAAAGTTTSYDDNIRGTASSSTYGSFTPPPGIPLNGGPHLGPQWFTARASVVAIYSAVVTSMMGECYRSSSGSNNTSSGTATNNNFSRSYALMDKMIHTMV